VFHLHRQVDVNRMKLGIRNGMGKGLARSSMSHLEGNDPHRGLGRVCEGGVRQGMVNVRLLCFRCLSPFLKLV
jgi:hypothetical protein